MKKPLFYALMAASLAFAGCDTTDQVTGDEETQSAADNSFADSEFSRMTSSVDIQARLDPDLAGKTAKSVFCPNADVIGTNNGDGTYSLVLDFGAGCNCVDGRTRYGKLTTNITGKWSATGTTATITPTDYKVKGLDGTLYSVSFNKTITVNQLNGAGNYNYTTDVRNAIFTSTKGTASWEAQHTTEWIGGQSTLFDATDNVYSITGAGQGNASNNVNYTVNITKPLIVKANCSYITEGVIEVKPDGRQTRTIDYGNGSCDANATFSVGGFSKSLVLN